MFTLLICIIKDTKEYFNIGMVAWCIEAISGLNVSGDCRWREWYKKDTNKLQSRAINFFYAHISEMVDIYEGGCFGLYRANGITLTNLNKSITFSIS